MRGGAPACWGRGVGATRGPAGRTTCRIRKCASETQTPGRRASASPPLEGPPPLEGRLIAGAVSQAGVEVWVGGRGGRRACRGCALMGACMCMAQTAQDATLLSATALVGQCLVTPLAALPERGQGRGEGWGGASANSACETEAPRMGCRLWAAGCWAAVISSARLCASTFPCC